MIEILKMEIKKYSDLPPVLQDTIIKKWKCNCDGNEVDKIIISSIQTDIYYICRKCGLIKKMIENILEANV